MPVIATVPRTLRLTAGNVYDSLGEKCFDVFAYIGSRGYHDLMVYKAEDGNQWYSHGLCCLSDALEAIPELKALDVDRDWGTSKREAFAYICEALTEYIQETT